MTTARQPRGRASPPAVRPAGRWSQRRVIAARLLAPLVLIALDARSAGWSELHRDAVPRALGDAAAHTVVLCALVVRVLAAVIGIGAAWLTERTALPGRRVWTVLLVLPVAIPDFVVGYAWHSFAPTAQAAARARRS